MQSKAVTKLPSNFIVSLLLITSIIAIIYQPIQFAYSAEEEEKQQGLLEYLLDNNFFAMVLSSAVLMIAAYGIAKSRGVVKKINKIDDIERKQTEMETTIQKLNKMDVIEKEQKDIKEGIEKIDKKVDSNREVIDKKVSELKDEHFKVKEETHRMIMEYLLGIRTKTGSGAEYSLSSS
jgi:hypothetical protein